MFEYSISFLGVYESGGDAFRSFQIIKIFQR